MSPSIGETKASELGKTFFGRLLLASLFLLALSSLSFLLDASSAAEKDV